MYIPHSALVMSVSLLALAACNPAPPPFNPDDPGIVATIDSLVAGTIEGAAAADADKVLAIADSTGELTFITGDVLLAGLEPIREQFRATYTGIQSQQQSFTTKRVRLLSPDVAVVMAVGEGSYTDKSGWTSAPVGMGTTIVFVREGSQWRARHVHQSIAP
jgi:uncharacterized protein (TIGR02246 family)